jgi:hypothetical protein
MAKRWLNHQPLHYTLNNLASFWEELARGLPVFSGFPARNDAAGGEIGKWGTASCSFQSWLPTGQARYKPVGGLIPRITQGHSDTQMLGHE